MARVHGVQLNIAWEAKAGNHRRVRELLEDRGLAAGDLVVLPEMFATGFSMRVGAVAERDGGETERFLADFARRHRIYIVGGIAARSAADPRKGRNLALAVGPNGEVLGRYAKRHPFSYAGETSRYEAGEAYLVFGWRGFTVAPFICYDLRFPESFRRTACLGANLFLVIANWPAARREHWRILLQARAIENQAYVVGVNRVGSDPEHAYAGDSLAVGPRGELLADAGGGETVMTAELDLQSLNEYRRSFPALRDMADGFRYAQAARAATCRRTRKQKGRSP
jgi:predicted amidohydrolase